MTPLRTQRGFNLAGRSLLSGAGIRALLAKRNAQETTLAKLLLLNYTCHYYY
jgi:hypothetical protein